MAGSSSSTSDPFTAFWSEFMGKMWTAMPGAAGGGPAAMPNPSNEVTAQMRRMFFDAMSAHAEQFMRSEAFLTTMKQAMDNALAWQQMTKDFLQNGLAQVQIPSRADADHTVTLVRGAEERILSKLQEMERRLDAVDGRSPRGAATRKSSPEKAAAKSNAKAKPQVKSAGKPAARAGGKGRA